MKPLYWKLLLILGAVIVGASLVGPKALRKNALVDLDEVPHTELILEVDEDYLLQKMLESEASKLQDSLQQAGIKASVRQKNGYGYMLLRDGAILSGADLKGASYGLHPFNNYPVLNFTFKAAGSKKFCEFTSAHIGEPFAVVINDEIITAPYINGAICGGQGFIEGNFTMKEAEDLALRLNAGTLPTKLRVVEERVVGPPFP